MLFRDRAAWEVTVLRLAERRWLEWPRNAKILFHRNALLRRKCLKMFF